MGSLTGVLMEGKIMFLKIFSNSFPMFEKAKSGTKVFFRYKVRRNPLLELKISQKNSEM